jgi:copper homeostasis protein
MLDSDNELDEVNTRELVTLARPLQVTFHKAIDDISDIVNATKKLKEIGVDRILSSGGADTAMQGKENLSKMLEIAGSSMKIVVAGKVTFENFEEIKSVIPSTEFHGRRLVDFL